MSGETLAIETRAAALVAELGLAGPVLGVTPLSGGVASDIARVDLASGPLCVKFALPKLKVAADWRAPVHRNQAEYAWLEVAARIAPEGAVRLFGRSRALHGFAMEFVAGDDVVLWKDALLAGRVDENDGARVGALIGRIHAASARPGFDRSAFDNRDDFRALRIEPYLTYTAGRHPGIAPPLNALAEALYASGGVLVHGDVSPKNILFRAGAPVVLDAECATMGDASFDPAFCLNHLMLKAFHMPKARGALVGQARRFWAAYAREIDWEPAAAVEARVARLLPALMLARVDGKSPVEYLDEAAQARVRAFSVPLIRTPAPGLGPILSLLEELPS